MNLEIAGKTALIMGAGGGLGGAIARTLSQEGVRVALADIDIAAIDKVRAEIQAAGGDALTMCWNIADLAAADGNIGIIEKEFGPVDILVNNTGGPPPTPAAGQDISLWTQSFHSMILPVIGVTDRILPKMRERKWGRIITSTSSGVIAPIPNLGISNTLRLSLVGWSKTLAREVARSGITANIVVPGRIATNRIRLLDEKKAEREGRSVEAVTSESVSSIPAGRYGLPQDYADMVAFLASERAAYITGSVMRVDGGLIASI